MKEINRVKWMIVILWVSIWALDRIHTIGDQYRHNELIQEIQERDYMDSLYWDHLESCAFVSNKEIKTDSRGYFYSQYIRKYK